MSEELFGNPVDLESQESELVTLVNPNNFEYSTNGHTFKPFVKYLVKKEKASYMLAMAQQDVMNRDIQRKYERQKWASCVMSSNQLYKDSALKFCDADGNPLSPAFERPLLVNYDTQEGKQIVAKALPVMNTKTEKEVAEIKKREIDNTIVLERPSAEWEKDKLVEYIKIVSGSEPPPSYHGNKTLLMKRANEVFEQRKEQFTKLGVDFKEV